MRSLHPGTLSLIALIGALVSLPAYSVDLRLPDIGASSDAVMTSVEEKRLGKEFMRSVRKQLTLIDDPVMNEYTQSIGERLVQAADAGGRHFEFFLVDDPSINAFAGPDGYIGVNAGLIMSTQNESELASVLSHEIAHITQRHLFRAIEDAQQSGGKTAALLITGLILGAAVSPELGQAAIVGAQASAVQSRINFTRSNEEEADRIGIRALSESSFDPRSMAGFFGRLGQATRVYDQDAPDFLRTHPVTVNRISEAAERAEAFPYRQYTNDLRYELVKAALKVRTYSDPAEAVRFFNQSLKDKRYSNETAQRYSYALALGNAGQPEQALEQVEQLLQQHPTQAEFVLAKALFQQKTGQQAAALQTLTKGARSQPGNYPIALAHADALVDSGRHDEAKKTLSELVETYPYKADLYDLLSRTSGALGRVPEAQRYRAEFHYLNDDLEPAIKQLELSLRSKDISYYDSELTTARLAQMKAEMEARKADR